LFCSTLKKSSAGKQSWANSTYVSRETPFEILKAYNKRWRIEISHVTWRVVGMNIAVSWPPGDWMSGSLTSVSLYLDHPSHSQQTWITSSQCAVSLFQWDLNHQLFSWDGDDILPLDQISHGDLAGYSCKTQMLRRNISSYL